MSGNLSSRNGTESPISNGDFWSNNSTPSQNSNLQTYSENDPNNSFQFHQIQTQFQDHSNQTFNHYSPLFSAETDSQMQTLRLESPVPTSLGNESENFGVGVGVGHEQQDNLKMNQASLKHSMSFAKGGGNEIQVQDSSLAAYPLQLSRSWDGALNQMQDQLVSPFDWLRLFVRNSPNLCPLFARLLTFVILFFSLPLLIHFYSFILNVLIEPRPEFATRSK